jgi:hypothetical protein
MSDEAADRELVGQVHQALRWYRNEIRLARSPLRAWVGGTACPLGALEQVIALRALLSAGVERLAVEDEVLGHLLRQRFLEGSSVRKLGLQGWARSTLFRYQRRAIVRLTRILLEMQRPGPAAEPF